MQLKLTRVDFAEALAMKPNCAFIQKMFNCIDKDGDGKISFQQFLDVIVRFSSGNAEDRLRVFFDMCDTDGTGLIEHTQLFDLLRYKQPTFIHWSFPCLHNWWLFITGVC